MPTSVAFDNQPQPTYASPLAAGRSSCPSRRLWRSSRADSPRQLQIRRSGATEYSPSVRRYYPTWIDQRERDLATMEKAIALENVFLGDKPKRLGLLVDTGAHDNLGGSVFSDQFIALLAQYGLTTNSYEIPEISVSGVGAGARVCAPDGAGVAPESSSKHHVPPCSLQIC